GVAVDRSDHTVTILEVLYIKGRFDLGEDFFLLFSGQLVFFHRFGQRSFYRVFWKCAKILGFYV
ncbi:MAG: hypothetical protein ACOC55_03610, partial [Candidatus Natronoplasma sp.]